MLWWWKKNDIPKRMAKSSHANAHTKATAARNKEDPKQQQQQQQFENLLNHVWGSAMVMNNKYNIFHWMHANKLSQFHWKICKNLLFGLCSATLEQGERDRAFYSVQKMYLLHSHTHTHSHPIYRNKSALSHVMWVWAEARWSMKNHFFPSICHCELPLFLICDNLWHTKPYFIFQFCLAAFFLRTLLRSDFAILAEKMRIYEKYVQC